MGIFDDIKRRLEKPAEQVLKGVVSGAQSRANNYVRDAGKFYSNVGRETNQHVIQPVARPVINYQRFVNKSNQDFANKYVPKPVNQTINYINKKGVLAGPSFVHGNIVKPATRFITGYTAGVDQFLEDKGVNPIVRAAVNPLGAAADKYIMNGKDEFQANTGIDKFIFGNEKVRTPQADTKMLQSSSYTKGNLGKLPTPILAGGAIAFGGLTNLTGMGKTPKAAQTLLFDIAKSKESQQIIKMAAEKGIKILPKEADQLAKITKASKVATVLGDRLSVLKGKGHVESVIPSTENINQLLKNRAKQLAEARKGDGGVLGDGNLGIVSKVKTFAKKQAVDKYAAIEDRLRLSKAAGAVVDVANDIHHQLDRVLKSSSEATSFIRGVGQFGKTHTSLEKVVANAPDYNKLDAYVLAKQVLYRESTGVKTGENLADAKNIVNQLGPEYEKHAEGVYQYSKDLLNYIVDSGLIDAKTAKQLIKDNPTYVPLNRILDEIANVGQYTGGAANLSKQTVVRQIKGSAAPIESPLASLISKTTAAFNQGERNKAAQMLASYKDLPFFKGEIRELTAKEAAGNKNTFSYLDNGVKRTFEASSDIVAAAKNLDAQELGLWGKIFSVPARALRLGTTGVSLPFFAVNIIRDQVSLAINSNKALQTSPLNPKNFTLALFSAIGHDKLYHEAVSNGAMQTSFDISRNSEKLNVKKLASTKNAGTRILYTVSHPGELWRAVENTFGKSEEFTRLQSYRGTRQSLLKGDIPDEEAQTLAATAARENTVNFARNGEYMRVVSAAVPYLNPGIQGARTLVRSVKTRPMQTMTKISLLALMPEAMATAWNLSDPKRKAAYDDLQDYEKEGSIIIVPPDPTQDAEGNWNIIKIPLSQEIANMTAMVRRPMEQAAGLDPVTFNDVARAIIGTVTPVDAQSTTKAISPLIPSFAKEPVQQFANKDMFTGNPIVPESQKDLPANMQFGKNTTSTAKVIGGALNVSPSRIDHAAKAIFGEVGREAMHYGDVGLNKLGVIPADQVKGKSATEAIGSRFTRGAGGKQEDRVWEQVGKQSKIDSIVSSFKKGNMTESQASTAIDNLGKGKEIRIGGNSLTMGNGKTALVENGKVILGKNMKEAQLAQDKARVEETGEPITRDGIYIYRKSNGDIGTKNTADIKASAKEYTLEQNVSKAKAARILGDYNKFQEELRNVLIARGEKLDPVADEVAILQIKRQIEKIDNDVAKFNGQGGFTKGGSGSHKAVGNKTRLSFKKFTAPTPAKTSTVKIKVTGGLSGKTKRPRVKLPKSTKPNRRSYG